MKKSFNIKAKVWRWPASAGRPGDGGWHFVTLDKKLYEGIRKKYPKGFVRVEAKIKKTIWITSLFPHKNSNSYLLCITKKIRKAEDIFKGDDIKVKINLL